MVSIHSAVCLYGLYWLLTVRHFLLLLLLLCTLGNIFMKFKNKKCRFWTLIIVKTLIVSQVVFLLPRTQNQRYQHYIFEPTVGWRLDVGAHLAEGAHHWSADIFWLLGNTNKKWRFSNSLWFEVFVISTFLHHEITVQILHILLLNQVQMAEGQLWAIPGLLKLFCKLYVWVCACMRAVCVSVCMHACCVCVSVSMRACVRVHACRHVCVCVPIYPGRPDAFTWAVHFIGTLHFKTISSKL